MTPVLEVQDLRRNYGNARGLAGLTLTIAAGEIYGLLGPNGAGKTSLVRAITGRLRLDAGSVRISGSPPTDPSARRGLGLVPQDIALYPDLSVAENLVLLAELAGMPRRDAEAALPATLAWIDLTDRATDQVASLSGGQQRRVNLAAGVLHQPALLVLDEPTAGVDLPARDRIHRMLADLRARGMAILLATHDLDQAAELSDRIGILVEGALRIEGNLASLVERCFPGGARDLTLTLDAEPPVSGRQTLESLGLAPGADVSVWHASHVGGLEQLPQLLERLTAAGLAVRDVRVREPGLAGVFLRATGREFSE